MKNSSPHKTRKEIFHTRDAVIMFESYKPPALPLSQNSPRESKQVQL